MKKALVTLFLTALLGSAFAVNVASAAVTRPGCHNYGILHTGC